MQEKSEPLPTHIGPYPILKSLGKGGMGEVFLAHDTLCERTVALKRIRTNLATHPIIKERFLREAKITSQLAHPSIVPIYSLHEEGELLYYIMPYLEGTTLRELIREEKSASFFTRIFTSLCQAVAYAHSKGFLHRDLKPENVIVGTYGQVYILDWGLVKPIGEKEEESEVEGEEGLTRPGKLVGTIAYMAPERIMGGPSTVASDVYALGVIFYQLLTLHLPFKRASLKLSRANLAKERLVDPVELAPYRDIAPELALVAGRCLAPRPQDRYQKIDHLIDDLQSFLEGRSAWILKAHLHPKVKRDWEFQEHTLVPGPVIGQARGSSWAHLMLSKAPFLGNVQLQVQITILDGHGIGFILAAPPSGERHHPLEGYNLWLSAKEDEPSALFRSVAEVMQFPGKFLPRNVPVTISLEKVDQHIHCSINDEHLFSYTSYLPLSGSHYGLIIKDTGFELEPISVHIGSLQLKVSCLAIPDAFLAHGDFAKALFEYRRIAEVFEGRQESREALFRAGITSLEQAKSGIDKETHFNLALLEFEKLKGTAGAPLEYLGKALVYQTMGEVEEEVKCLALGLRRYCKHPLARLLEEHLLFRLHGRSRQSRFATFQFALLVLQTMPRFTSPETEHLLNDLANSLEVPYFFEEPALALQLAFWLNKPAMIAELIDLPAPLGKARLQQLKNGLYALIHLGAIDLAKERIPSIAPPSFTSLLQLIDNFSLFIDQALANYKAEEWDEDSLNPLYCLFDKAILENKPKLILKYAPKLSNILLLDSYLIWAHLLLKEPCKELFAPYDIEDEKSPLHFLYGCFLFLTEGAERAGEHFQTIMDRPFPPLSSLATHYIYSRGIEPAAWLAQAFDFEKQQLYKQLALFYHCSDNSSLCEHYRKLARDLFQ